MLPIATYIPRPFPPISVEDTSARKGNIDDAQLSYFYSAMKYSQSTFSFLLPLTDEEIFEQIEYCQQKGWAVSVEHTSNPDPRNHFWERWGIPLLDRGDPKLIMIEIQQCRRAYPKHYIKVTGFNMGSGKTSIEISFFVYRPQA